MFANLKRMKDAGLSFSQVLVKSFLDEHGPTPYGKIADACGISIRSVEMAVAKLKAVGLFQTKILSHDHDIKKHEIKGTAKSLSANPESICGIETNEAAAPSVEPKDPLVERLLALDVLPWCVDQLLAKVPRAQVEQQIAWHEHRLASGFIFKTHPARFLFSACLHNYGAPADFKAKRYAGQQGGRNDGQVSQYPNNEQHGAAGVDQLKAQTHELITERQHQADQKKANATDPEAQRRGTIARIACWCLPSMPLASRRTPEDQAQRHAGQMAQHGITLADLYAYIASQAQANEGEAAAS